MSYKVHPVAALFPMIPKGSRPYNDLEENIRLCGQLEAIVVDGDVLLDGRNRLVICEENGITPKVVQWSTLGVKNPQHEWIFGKNVARRNLTEEQRLAVYVEYNAWTETEYAREKKARAQFKPGNEESKLGGLAKAGALPVESKSTPPAPRDLDVKEANSTAGKVAAASGVSTYKAKKLIAIDKAAKAGDEQAKEDFEAVKTGLKTLREVSAPKKKEKPQPSMMEEAAKAIARLEKLDQKNPDYIVVVSAVFRWSNSRMEELFPESGKDTQ